MSESLKVLVASINFAPDHAGIGIYSTDFSVYLVEKGHQVTMVAFEGAHEMPPDVKQAAVEFLNTVLKP